MQSSNKPSPDTVAKETMRCLPLRSMGDEEVGYDSEGAAEGAHKLEVITAWWPSANPERFPKRIED